MTLDDLKSTLDIRDLEREVGDLMGELFPIPRSITGDGVRRTLAILRRQLPLEVCEVPTGTRVLDWTVPREWNIRGAWIKDPAGQTIVDLERSSLHVMGYSVPLRAQLSLDELRPHVHTLQQHPDWIPYRNSYHSEGWAFCMSHAQLEALRPGSYDVCIDATLAPGHLTYGECELSGTVEDEVLISCHVCHPSLANDNVAGMALAALLGRYLAARPRRYTYRLLFVPVTIGSITWLARNEARLGRIKHGLVVTCVGDPGHSTYKKSRRGDADVDRAAIHVLEQSGAPYRVEEFFPYGYDERQYCSPGFDLPVGCLMRTPHGRYPQYHTSADDLDFVRPEFVLDSLSKYLAVLDVLERNRSYRNTHPKGEPQLGRRGLYRGVDSLAGPPELEMALLWVLNLSDGRNDLLDIARRARTPFAIIARAAALLQEHELLEEVKGSDPC